MLRQTRLMAAADFKQKSRWSYVWPNMHYGAMYLNYSVGRKMPMKGVNWVTRDSNRLTSFSERYGAVIADLDVKRNEEELSIPLADIRWNDHRRIYWKCSFCGSSYRKNVSVRTKFHAGCNACKRRFSSEVLQGQTAVRPLAEQHPALAAKLNPENEKNPNVASLSVTSKFEAEWKCEGCGQPYRASIRSRTGEVEPGQAPVHPQAPAWSAHCPACSWRANMQPLAEKILREKRGYLGLEELPERPAEKIPRRRKLTA
ncbi:hypothetical protein STCU_02125 [Strigomonas culicis]|uniref:Treble clef zinc finger domain-containing protein n=1 Tax=Strigomonas culicis TaxID=28005 RepID=S9U7B1_9TRYP|nr:hypothetical protein STCU_06999 [Strigomonas culicis]EPY33624.1 hypothetical protein STCU_02125 [Strigomonas culicis]|eukprot:EPY24798.1 hypothetical protein STCU_06999 [Strigomonas culicis]